MDIKLILNSILEQIKTMYKQPLVISLLVATFLFTGKSFISILAVTFIFVALYYIACTLFFSKKSKDDSSHIEDIQENHQSEKSEEASLTEAPDKSIEATACEAK